MAKIVRNRFALLLAKKTERDGRSNITHEEVAAKTGLGESTISRYANNHIHQYAEHVIDALCEYFDCEPGDLIVRVEQESEEASEGQPSLSAIPA